MNALIIDHDDSFTENLRHWLNPLFKSILVINHIELYSKQINLESLNLIVLSPGPKNPLDYPHVINWIQSLNSNIPIFGVCLGMQLIGCLYGYKIVKDNQPHHGKKTALKIFDDKHFIFKNLSVARYHSLYIDLSLNKDFHIIASTLDNKIPLWIEHKSKKIIGFQFHPESFITEDSYLFLDYINDWLKS